jgi:hypothetical protein
MSDYKVKHGDEIQEDHHDIGEDLGMTSIWGISLSFFFLAIAISAWLVGVFGNNMRIENEIKVLKSTNMTLLEVKQQQLARLSDYTVVDADLGRVTVTIEDAKRRAVRDLIRMQRNPPRPTMLLNGTVQAPVNPCNPAAANPCADDQAEVTGSPGTARGAV